MEAILLGSAGDNPAITNKSNTIKIPSILPSTPVVLTEAPFFEGSPREGSETSHFPDNVIIYRDGLNRVSLVVRDSKTVSITRDANGVITSVSDNKYRRNINRVNGIPVSITVTKL